MRSEYDIVIEQSIPYIHTVEENAPPDQLII